MFDLGSLQVVNNEKSLINTIKKITSKWNRDNISRTKAYANYFNFHPEVKWSFLASMVSRNAGYNMCDLEGEWFPKVLPIDFRHTLFMTYERANWLIFQDAYPQLLLYHYSTKLNMPMFHLGVYFNNSEFIMSEWRRFWGLRDEKRLLVSLIINEQNIIQEPVIEHSSLKKKVFRSFVFGLQDYFHFSTVIFPTLNGDLYGASVSKFRKIDSRIELGKRLGSILFNQELFPLFLKFSIHTEHTGSRLDYEQYFPYKKRRNTPFLRTTYPIITHHNNHPNQWDKGKKIKKMWHESPTFEETILLNDWYKKKQLQLQALMSIESLFKKGD
ncbi:DUF2515 family protein [Peribacillus alkalitolerans]|uniref:DUF2515 family protein n=1 Tax=Peribacillus alkalitolerans TaxID=1550385 RepID=UPI0013D7F42A|nr:DUF2515 family protein [Peribacillus alkalitolerans]